jgi:bifunctional DNase/RNase
MTRRPELPPVDVKNDNSNATQAATRVFHCLRRMRVLECQHHGNSIEAGGSVMVEVEIDSIRVSLMSQHRIVILKELNSERFLPIWIGPYEAEAITVSLQQMEVARPLTHDLLRNVRNALEAEVLSINITELRENVFYARIMLRVNGKEVSIDSRPSDALALAVRVHVPVYVDESVMDEASSLPQESIDGAELSEDDQSERLEVFKDFVETLDLEDTKPNDGDAED